MAGAVIYHVLSFVGLLFLGVYHLSAAAYSFLKSPREYSAKPFHPLPLPSPRLRLLPLYIAAAFLFISFFLHLIYAALPDPLVAGHSPVHLFTTLQSSSVIFLFFLLSLFIIFSSDSPSDLIFAVASASFFLLSSASSSHSSSLSSTSTLESKLDSISSRISALSSLLSLLLAFFPRLFVADLAFSASLCLQAFWIVQSTLVLHVDSFIPDGCHRLLDVVAGVEGSTTCELDEAKFRAVALLDLMFAVYVVIVVLIVFAVYVIVSRAVGAPTTSAGRRFGSYEALPTTTTPASGAIDNNHVQLKTISGTQE